MIVARRTSPPDRRACARCGIARGRDRSVPSSPDKSLHPWRARAGRHDRRRSHRAAGKAPASSCSPENRAPACRRFPPDRDIGAGIAGIDEPFRTETLDQCLGFRGPAEVVAAVRRDHFIENAEMIGDLLRYSTVCRRGQHQHAALRPLLLQVSEEFAVIGQVSWIEIPASRQRQSAPRSPNFELFRLYAPSTPSAGPGLVDPEGSASVS